jgi:hypothetical protein
MSEDAAEDQGWKLSPLTRKAKDCDEQVARQRSELGSDVPDYEECADGHVWAQRVRETIAKAKENAS